MKKLFLTIGLVLFLTVQVQAAAFIPDAVIDLMLDGIATGTQLDITSDSSTPANLTNSLADVVLTPGDGNGDFTVAAGDVSGRKITIAEQADMDIDETGTARHIVISLGGTILAVFTCTELALTSGGTVTVPAFDHEVLDP